MVERKPYLKTEVNKHFKGPITKLLGSMDHTVPFTTTQFCHCRPKVTTDNIEMNKHNWVPATLNLGKQVVGHIFPMGHCLPIPVLYIVT